jgi:hypothetical protein
MRKLFFLPLFAAILFSCKKHNDDNTSSIILNDTRWNLHYKNNNTFSFFAESELFFKQNKNIDNYRNFDTISGNWSATNNTITINFNNGDKYTGTAISNDSISGTLTASGSNGTWYAVRK